MRPASISKLACSRKTDLGENVYELATDNKTVTAIYVNENTYREAEGDDADMQQLIVELTPAEVDPYAGFLNVDNETFGDDGFLLVITTRLLISGMWQLPKIICL